MDVSAWAGIGGSREIADRADAAWIRISEKPTAIVIVRSSGKTKAALAAQTVRLEYDYPSNYESKGAAGASSKQAVTVFGIVGHDMEGDTNIRRDDQFSADGLLYRVVSITRTQGEIQAKCEALG